MTSQVLDKKPENCNNFENCHKMRTVEDKDILAFQAREAALAICSKCQDFEEK